MQDDITLHNAREGAFEFQCRQLREKIIDWIR
jgi:hypothetical protein